jgi:hypothetical protein
MYTEEEKTKVKSLAAEGQSLRKISELTGIPKSTVSDWIQDGGELSNTPHPMILPDKKSTGSVFNEFPDKSYDVSDEFQRIFGQNKSKNELIMNEHEENKENRTVIQKKVSPELLDLKKLDIQLNHERELKKIAIEERAIALKEIEMSNFNIKRLNNAERLSGEIQALATELLNDGEVYECDTEKAEELLDKVENLLEEYIAFCNEYGYFYKNTEPFSFLTWVKKQCEAWIDEQDEEEEDDPFTITFTEKAIARIQSATGIDIYNIFL